MSEEWHYITYSDGSVELYDIKNDPMQWNNLLHENPANQQAAVDYLRSYLPVEKAEPIPDGRKKTSRKGLDKTIKPKRNLERLK